MASYGLIEIGISLIALVVSLISLYSSSKANRIAEASNVLAKEANKISKESNRIAEDGLLTSLNRDKPFFKVTLKDIKFPNDGMGLKNFDEVFLNEVPDCTFFIENISQNNAYKVSFEKPGMEYNDVEILANVGQVINTNFQIQKFKDEKPLYIGNDMRWYEFRLELHWENIQRQRYCGYVNFKCKIEKFEKKDVWLIKPLENGKCEVEYI